MKATWALSNTQNSWLEMLLLFGSIVALFLVFNWLHFQFLPVHVIFYACVVDALISLSICAPAYLMLRRKAGFIRRTEFVATCFSGLCVVLLYALVGPTVVDRSLSLYIVQKVEQRGGAVAESAMPALFVEEYMPEFRLVDVRLTEQLQSGTLTLRDGCLRITNRGRVVARFADFYRRNFLPKRRVLLREVTNQLSDPFRNAPQRVDVTCPVRGNS